MKTASKLLPFLLLLIPLIFFYKTIFYGQIPFPGDLLVGNYEPYKSQTNMGFVPGSVPHKAQGPDVIKEIIPWKKFTIDSFKAGQIPFWNPYNFEGNPLMANFQSAIFFPANLIFLIFDFNTSWSFYILLIPILASLFTYLFLRRLQLSKEASIFGGIIFAFSSYMSVWMEYGNIGYTFLFLPLVLYLVDIFLEKITVKNFLGIVLTCFLASLAGYIQGLFYLYGVVIFYFLFKGYFDKKLNVRKLILFILGLSVPILLSAFQLLPTLSLFGQSSRGNYTLEQIQNMLNPVYYLVTLIVPDFFGNPAARNYWIDGTYIERVSYFGLIPFILAIYAFISQFKKVEIKIFSILFILTIILATDLFFTKFFYLIPIPVISTTVATRILSIATFAGCVLASFGLEFLMAKKYLKVYLISTLTIFIILLVLFGFTIIYPQISKESFVLSLSIAKRNLLIPLFSIIMFILSALVYLKLGKQKAIKKFGKVALISIIFIITFADLFYYFQKITPFSPAEFMYPKTQVVSYLNKQTKIDRIWGYGAAEMESNFQTFEKLYSTEGNDPLHIRKYTEFAATSANGRLPEVLPRPDANIARGFGKEEMANNPYRQKALNIAGVKYVLNKDESINGDYNPDYTTFPEDNYKLIWQKGFWQVYENKMSLPRIFITDKYIVEPNEKRALKKLYSSSFNEHEQILLNENPKIISGKLTSSSKLISYNPNKIEINAMVSKSALLFLSDSYYPDWEARVDGVKTKIFQADYAFRAIVIPAGKHLVTFEYNPKSFYYGIYIGLIGIVLLILMSIYIRNNKKLN